MSKITSNYDSVISLLTSWGNIVNKPTTVSGFGITDAITNPVSSSQGDILIRGETDWTRLPAGNAGQYLQTQGSTANPVWDNPIANIVEVVIASLPTHYSRDTKWAQKTNVRTSLTSPSTLAVNINNNGYILNSSIDIDITSTTSWDATSPTNYTTASNRSGKDFYIYACQPSSGTTPVFKLSVNSTVPTGYTASNSRKIGGFHCLCTAVGTISGHTLTGYAAGDILPASVWDLLHKPKSSPEGMVYVDSIGLWVDIYLSSVSGSTLVSVNGATIADGASAVKFHWYKGAEWLGRTKKRLLFQNEFFQASAGANQSTNITGSADPNTTTGHTDTAGRRMISNYGLEDTCGVLCQWGMDSLSGGADSWAYAYDANDAGVGGQHYRPPNRVLLGGPWADGVLCGSRGCLGVYGPLFLGSNCGLRGCAEPGI